MNKCIYVVFLLILSCSKNILTTDASSNNDDAFYQQALDYLNQKKYDEAILVISTKISVQNQMTPSVRELLASNYAGKCGLEFIPYIDKLSTANTGSALRVMMEPFINSVVDPSFCKQALATIDLIGTTSNRTVNQNFFASVVGMVLLGTSLRSYADINPILGDGVADVDICAAVTDQQIDDMIIGFGYFNLNFSSVSSQTIGNYTNSMFGPIGATCAAVAGASCTITDPTQITPFLRLAFRDLVNTQEYRIGNFATGGNQLLIPGSCP